MSIRFLAALALMAMSCVASAEQPPAEDGPQVTFEVRIVTIPADLQLANGPAKEGEAVFLKDAQMKTLLETVQGVRRTNVMQAPRITAFHDQAMVVNAVEQQKFISGLEAMTVNGETVCVPKAVPVELGMKLSLRGRISADKTAVAVEVKYADKRVEKVEMIPVVTQVAPVFEGGSRGKPMPFTQYLQAPQFTTVAIEKKDLRVPSGGHVAIAGPSYQTEVREEHSMPILGEIPIAGRLFRTIGIAKLKMRTILIVSPTVVEAE